MVDIKNTPMAGEIEIASPRDTKPPENGLFQVDRNRWDPRRLIPDILNSAQEWARGLHSPSFRGRFALTAATALTIISPLVAGCAELNPAQAGTNPTAPEATKEAFAEQNPGTRDQVFIPPVTRNAPLPGGETGTNKAPEITSQSAPESAPLTAEEKEQLLGKLQEVQKTLTAISQPGVLKDKLNKRKYSFADVTHIDTDQDELDGRLKLERILGKNPSLDEYRTKQQGSTPPPEEGYLEATMQAIKDNRLKTVIDTEKRTIATIGADRLLILAASTLVSYQPGGGRYSRILPTEETKRRYETAGRSSGITDIEDWSKSYFQLSEVLKEVQSKK